MLRTMVYKRRTVWNAVLWVLTLYKCLSCVSLVGWRVLFFCRPLFSTLMVPFGLVHSVKSCDAIFLIYFFIFFIFLFSDFVAMLLSWLCCQGVRASAVSQWGVDTWLVVRSNNWVAGLLCSHLQLMKSEAYLTNRLVNLFLVTGELGTFCHRSCPPSLDLSNPVFFFVLFCLSLSHVLRSG